MPIWAKPPLLPSDFKKKGKQVVVFAAHPGDEVLGVGGTICKHIQEGDFVTVVYFTTGFLEDSDMNDYIKNTKKRLGFQDHKVSYFDCMRLDSYPLIEIVNKINGLISGVKPDILYTHWKDDVNQDHRTVYEASLVMCRHVNNSCPHRVLAYDIPVFPSTGTEENWYVDITPYISRKMNIIGEFPEGLYKPTPHIWSKESQYQLARANGIKVWMYAAEKFHLVYNTESGDFYDKKSDGSE